MSIELKAFDFIEDVENSIDEESLAKTIQMGFEEFGFESVVALKLPGPNETMEDNMYINSRNSEFATVYFEQDMTGFDPVVEQCANSFSAFTWSSAYNVSDIKGAEKVHSLAQDYKMKDGIAIPVPVLGSFGVLSASTTQSDILPMQFHAASLLGMAGMTKLLTFERQKKQRSVKLSPREKEILQWVAVGKTDREIAEIMSLSPNTIRNHVENIKVRINAPNRTAAAVKALVDGLIHL